MAWWLQRVTWAGVDVMILIAAGALSVLLQPGGLAWPRLAAYDSPLLLTAGFYMAAFLLFGLYRRLWRYAGVGDLLAMLGACAVAGAAMLLIPGVPAGMRALHWLMATAGLCAWRLGARAWQEVVKQGRTPPVRRLLIAGAGNAGVELVRELKRHDELGIRPVGFVDDDPAKQGLLAHGIPVAGSSRELAEAARRSQADEVIIAMPSAPGSAIRRIWTEALACRLPVRILPPVRELARNQRLAGQLRQVQISDLLGRAEVKIDLAAVRACLEGRTVLVTGGGGSIGSELCRQAAAMGPAALVLMGHGENSLFQIEQELRLHHPRLPIHPVVGDIRDAASVDAIMERFRPAVVFHAAAHKHVPLMEANPHEAVGNNVLGTYHVAAAADRCGVERFVLISTDKAVSGASVMGATKRAAERIILTLAAQSQTTFLAVRFGNVLGSRGSVVPLFQQQIARGGPVTVTDPEATRYFMTIPEAARLVLQAATMGQGGDIFVLDMGEPVRVLDLARDLIRLEGLTPDVDIPVIFTGLRPGERLTEALFTPEEGVSPTSHERILRARAGPECLLDLTAAVVRFRQMAADRAATARGILAALTEASKGGSELEGDHDDQYGRGAD